MQLPGKQTRTAAQLHTLECANRIGFPVVLRTDVQMDSDVITKTQISCIHGFTKFSWDPCARLARAELSYYSYKHETWRVHSIRFPQAPS